MRHALLVVAGGTAAGAILGVAIVFVGLQFARDCNASF